MLIFQGVATGATSYISINTLQISSRGPPRGNLKKPLGGSDHVRDIWFKKVLTSASAYVGVHRTNLRVTGLYLDHLGLVNEHEWTTQQRNPSEKKETLFVGKIDVQLRMMRVSDVSRAKQHIQSESLNLWMRFLQHKISQGLAYDPLDGHWIWHEKKMSNAIAVYFYMRAIGVSFMLKVLSVSKLLDLHLGVRPMCLKKNKQGVWMRNIFMKIGIPPNHPF